MSLQGFWDTFKESDKPTQKRRYEEKNSPDYIMKFINIGGGGRMGVTLEHYARFHFSDLKKRDKKKKVSKKKNTAMVESPVTDVECETGYDQIIMVGESKVFIEQKSSGHWGADDYKWQHIESKHKWHMLLLCGIDYEDIKFWGMNRTTFSRLISEGKITNQGEKTGKSSEGMWFTYSAVKDSLVEIKSNEELSQFASESLLQTSATL
jgi:hypothetical protein